MAKNIEFAKPKSNNPYVLRVNHSCIDKLNVFLKISRLVIINLPLVVKTQMTKKNKVLEFDA